MSKCSGNLYKVLFDASGITLNPMDILPFSGPAEFRLYYNTGTPWSHFDDYSYAYSDSGALVDNPRIVVRDTSGAIISGIAPDAAAIKKMELSMCYVYSKERADWDQPGGNRLTKPSLTLKNIGSSVVDTVHLYYMFTTDDRPIFTANLLEQPEKGTVSLDSMGQNSAGMKQYAIHIIYKGINLHPGELIGNINFEITNISWVYWNYSDDPSFLPSDTLVHNPNILVLDGEANRRCGIHPDDYSFDTSSAFDEVTLEAAYDSISQYRSRPKIRVKNIGTEDIQSFRIYYYFAVEAGCTPTCGIVSAPGCKVRIEPGNAGSQYKVVYECIDANIEPGEYFPSIDGALVELRQYQTIGNFFLWDRSNDYSAEGLDETWQETDRIVVEDMDGNVLWGVKP